MIENILKQAKNAVTADWLSKIKELKETAIKAREAPQFEKLDRLDLRELAGTMDDPAVIQVKALNARRSVKTEKMEKPMTVFDAEVLMSSDPAIKVGSYAIWENTTVLAQEMQKFQDDNTEGDITGKVFGIAYFGQTPSKKRKNIMVHVFKVVP